LIDDFFNEFERVIAEPGISLEIIETKEGNRP
jgi:hypothetical protein